jgi:hypothetical protein
MPGPRNLRVAYVLVSISLSPHITVLSSPPSALDCQGAVAPNATEYDRCGLTGRAEVVGHGVGPDAGIESLDRRRHGVLAVDCRRPVCEGGRGGSRRCYGCSFDGRMIVVAKLRIGDNEGKRRDPHSDAGAGGRKSVHFTTMHLSYTQLTDTRSKSDIPGTHLESISLEVYMNPEIFIDSWRCQ